MPAFLRTGIAEVGADPGGESGVSVDVGGTFRPRRLSAGIVAHNEERTVGSALTSLLGQRLPDGVRWETLWVVASGCTDATVERAREVAASDRRVRVLVEPEREGKAHALRRVFELAGGEALVLLNGDAQADQGAVEALLGAAATARSDAPVAVMARPQPRWSMGEGRWGGLSRTLWDLHDRFHRELQGEEGGAHLSDELLLMSLPVPTVLPEGTVNDGSYLGVWMAQHGGRRLYAPSAVVRTEAPVRLVDHLHQRRRIYFGNQQVRTTLGRYPTTIVSRAARDPHWGVRFLSNAVRGRPGAARRIALLAGVEVTAALLASWDRLAHPEGHVRWRRIRRPDAARAEVRPVSTRASTPAATPFSDPVGSRVATIARLAAAFHATVPVPELLRLLPEDAPRTPEEFERWAANRPDVPRFPSAPPAQEHHPGPESTQGRRRRGEEYLAWARASLAGPLRPVLPWTRCVAVSGSTAYGEPEKGDDLDLFVVVRRGALWWFLAWAYAAGRLHRWRRRGLDGPTPCYNYVVDDRDAEADFEPQGDLLFAREALTVRCLTGEDYYRGLLGVAPWMQAVLPRIYSERAAAVRATQLPAAGWLVRLVSLVVFPGLAAYLQLSGLVRNSRFRRSGRPERMFRTRTLPSRFSFLSDRFESVRRLYAEELPTPAAATGVPGGTGDPRGRPNPLR